MSNELAVLHPLETGVATIEGRDVLSSPTLTRHLRELAKEIAGSILIPDELKNRPQDVFMLLWMAQDMRENPLFLLQSVTIIKGRFAWKAQYVLARMNACGRFRGPVQWRKTGEGMSLEVTAYATLRETGDEVSASASMAMAKAEGWYDRNPKYRSGMGEYMLRLRSATFLARLYAADVLGGLYEASEIEDIPARGRTASVETSYEEPPHASLPSSLSRSHQVDRQAVRSPGGGVRTSTSEGSPPLALPAPSPEAMSLPGGASSSVAAPRGEGPGANSSAEGGGSTPPSASSVLSSPAVDSSGHVGHPQADDTLSAPEATQAPDTTPVGAAEAPGQGAAAPTPEDKRKALLKVVEGYNKSHPDLLKELGRAQKLVSRNKASDEQLQQLIAAVEQRIALQSLSADDLMIRIRRVEQAVCAHIGLDDTLSLAQEAGLPIDTVGPVMDGAPHAMLERYLVALEQVTVPQTPQVATPQVFASPEVALAWGMDKGAFRDIAQAREAYNQVRREGQPENAHEMAAMWVAEVESRLRGSEVQS